MPATQPKFKEFPLTYEKGLVTEVEESTIELGQSSVLENWEPTAQGGLRARNRWISISRKGINPLGDIPTPKMWLKADAITGLSDGATVATWEDATVNNNDAAQATEANKPTYQTSEINGLPAVRFDGSNDWMETAAFAAEMTNTTIFAVAKKTADGSISQAMYDGLISGKRNALINLGSHVWSLQSGGSNVEGLESNASWHIFTTSFGPQDSLYVDGAHSVTGDSGGNALSGLTIGSRHDQALPFGGDIAEILVYDSVLSTLQRETVESYLAGKYGLDVTSTNRQFKVRGFGSIATGGSSGVSSGVQVVQTSKWPDGANEDPVNTRTATLTGCNIGNVLVAVVAEDSELTPTVTGGWTQRAVSGVAAENYVKFYTKPVAASTESFTYTISLHRIRMLTVYELNGLDAEDPGIKWAADSVFGGSSGSASLDVNVTDEDGGIMITGYWYDAGTPGVSGSGTSGYAGSTLDDSNSRTGVAFEHLDNLDGGASGSANYVTPSWTPPNEGVLIVLIAGFATTTWSLSNITGNGLTWHFTNVLSGTSGFAYAYAALDGTDGTPVTGAITVDANAQRNTACFFYIARGAPSTNPIQQSTASSIGTGPNQGVGLASNLQVNSGLLGMMFHTGSGGSSNFNPENDADDWDSNVEDGLIFALNSSTTVNNPFKAAHASSNEPTQNHPDWNNQSGSSAILGLIEVLGSGGAAQARHGSYNDNGVASETYNYVANKRITGKAVAWGHIPQAAQSASVDFYIVMALAIGTTEYEIYRILRDEITSGTWAKIDEVTDATSNSAWVAFAQGSGKLVWTATTLSAPRAISLSTMIGTNITDLAGRAGRVAVYHKDRMFIAGEDDLPSRVYFSAIGDPTDFVTATDFLDIGGDDGEAVQDAVSVEGLLLLCKTNRLYLVSGSGIETFFVNELPGGSAAAGRCVVRTPYGTIVAGTDDIWVVQGGAVDPMSRPLGAGYRITGNASCAYAQDSVLIADSGTGQVWRANLVTGAWMLEPAAPTSTPNLVYALFSLNGRLYYGTNLSTTQVGGTRQLSFDRTYDEPAGGTVYRASTGRMSLLGPSYKYSPRFLWMQLRNQDISKPAELLVTIESNLSLLPGFTSEPQSVRVSEETQRERLDLGRHKGAEWLKISYYAAASPTEAPMDIEKSVLGVLSEEYR